MLGQGHVCNKPAHLDTLSMPLLDSRRCRPPADLYVPDDGMAGWRGSTGEKTGTLALRTPTIKHKVRNAIRAKSEACPDRQLYHDDGIVCQGTHGTPDVKWATLQPRWILCRVGQDGATRGRKTGSSEARDRITLSCCPTRPHQTLSPKSKMLLGSSCPVVANVKYHKTTTTFRPLPNLT